MRDEGGKFLAKNRSNKLWFEVGDNKALKKAQTLIRRGGFKKCRKKAEILDVSAYNLYTRILLLFGNLIDILLNLFA